MPDLYACEFGWYCLKALPKKEHLAATMLGKEHGMEALAPRISFVKKTRRGKVRFVEALFPGYVFVRTELKTTYRIVMSAHGIRGVVKYGEVVPLIPDGFVEEIKSRLDGEGKHEEPEAAMEPGQVVTVLSGPFKDWEGLVAGVIPGKDRVKVLLEFLGQHLSVEMPAQELIVDLEAPKKAVWRS